MKKSIKILCAIIIMMFFSLITSCNNSESSPNAGINPFTNGGSERNMIVLLSDMHLGADLTYAECNKNRAALEKLIRQVKASQNVKELVIIGDLVDEWFVPAPINTYQGKDQRDFVERVMLANKEIFDALNMIIQEKKIIVTYVPGNHDLTITAENISFILPGITQVRDNEQGLGTYIPADYPKIAIEHSHRYNIFCAPDPISNQDIAPGTIQPSGYFFARIGALSVSQKFPPAGDSVLVVIPNTSGDESQYFLYVYYKFWEKALKELTISNKFAEKIIVTNINGLNGSFSVNDILPFQKISGGLIDVNLYKGIQDNWKQRQVINHVPVNIPTDQAIINGAEASQSDIQAKSQYFMNPNSDKRIVIFGHTHDAKIITSNNLNGQKSIYANTGTWIDTNPGLSTMDFIVVTPQNSVATSQTYVKLYNFKDQVVTKVAEDSLRY